MDLFASTVMCSFLKNSFIIFVTFTSAKSTWPLLLKCLYELNSKKLGFNIPFDKLEPKHVVNLI